MKLLLSVLTFALSLSVALCARSAIAAPPIEPLTAERVQPIGMPRAPEAPVVTITSQSIVTGNEGSPPRAKLSYLRHGLVDGGGPPMEALSVELVPLSWRRLRAGIQAEAGRGHGMEGSSATYGLLGVKLGLRLPRGVTPFISGLVGAGRYDGALPVPGTPFSVKGSGGVSGISMRGVDVGVDVYHFGKGSSLSLALGWVQTTVQDAGFNNAGAMVFHSRTFDGFLLKMGLVF